MFSKGVLQWLEMGSFFEYRDHRIFYYQDGDGDDLLIIHGYPFSSYEWNETVEELSKKYRVTVLDLLGFGFSDKPQNHEYSFEEYCDIINQLLQKLKISSTHIVAHDLGVSIAQELLSLDFEQKNNFRINTLIFINGGLFPEVYKPRCIQRLLSATPRIIGYSINCLIGKKSIFRAVKTLFGPHTKPSAEFLEEQWEIMNYQEGKSIAYLLGRLVFEKKRYSKKWTDVMKKTKVPISFICGPFDPNSGKHMADHYLAIIPNPRVFLLDKHIGHWPHVENKTETIKHIHYFIESKKASS